MVTERIRSFLDERGISISELARRMGVSQAAASQMLKGNPRFDTVERIAKALGVTMQELFPSDNLRPISQPTAADVVAMIESCPDPQEAIRFCMMLLKRERIYQQRVTRRKRKRASADVDPNE